VWVLELRKIVGPDIVVAVAGNKADMEKGRHVDAAEALRWTAEVGGTHHLTSAKSGAGVDEAFGDLARRIAARRKATAAAEKTPLGPSRSTVRIVDDEPARPKGGCC